MRPVLLLVCACVLVSCDHPSISGGPNACGGSKEDPECFTLAFSGTTRSYLLHVPSSFRAGSGALVVALHGLGDVAPDMAERSGLNAKADQAGFAVVYPNALVSRLGGLQQWNAYFFSRYVSNPPDDIGFLRQLIAELQQQLGPDPKRIYVTGLSNGGLMAHRVGVELSDVVAAIGVVAGTLASSPSISALPDATQPVSVLMLHGELDDNIPCCPFRASATQDDSFDYWVSTRANACSAVSTPEPICEGPETPSALLEKHATGCRGGVEVQFYKLQGGGHAWYAAPMNVVGSTPYNPFFDTSTGVTTNDILWNFFVAHPKG